MVKMVLVLQRRRWNARSRQRVLEQLRRSHRVQLGHNRPCGGVLRVGGSGQRTAVGQRTTLEGIGVGVHQNALLREAGMVVVLLWILVLLPGKCLLT